MVIAKEMSHDEVHHRGKKIYQSFVKHILSEQKKCEKLLIAMFSIDSMAHN